MGTIKGKIKKSYNPLVDKNVYKRRPVVYSTINADELLKLASRDSQIAITTLRQIFDGIRIQFTELLLNGHIVQLGELGSFRLSISAKAVSTEDQVGPELIKTRRILFLPSKELKQKLDGVKVQSFITQYIDSIDKPLNKPAGDLNHLCVTLATRSSMPAIAKSLKVYQGGAEDKLILMPIVGNKVTDGTDEVFTLTTDEVDGQTTIDFRTQMQAGVGPIIKKIVWV